MPSVLLDCRCHEPETGAVSSAVPDLGPLALTVGLSGQLASTATLG